MVGGLFDASIFTTYLVVKKFRPANDTRSSARTIYMILGDSSLLRGLEGGGRNRAG